MTDKTKPNQLNKTDKRVLISREFAAPRERLFSAFTEATQIKQWWGPKGYTCPVYQVDLREGGKFLGAMRGPDGNDIWGTGVFTEIAKPERLVYTDSFADAEGNVVPASHYNMSGNWPLECTVTLTFSEAQRKTILTLEHVGIPEEMISDCTQGWQESLDKLELLLKDSDATKGTKVSQQSSSTDAMVSP